MNTLGATASGLGVIATDVNDKLLEGLGAGIRTARLDVLDDKAVQAFVESTGAVDILFNCAGWVAHGTILDCTPEHWDRSFNLNVRSMFTVTKAMLPKMIAAGGGVILNMASVLGSEKAAPNRLAYAASKAAVAGFTRALAINTNDADFYVGRGKALLGLKKKDAAVADFNRAVELKPKLLDDLVDTLKTYDQLSNSK